MSENTQISLRRQLVRMTGSRINPSIQFAAPLTDGSCFGLSCTTLGVGLAFGLAVVTGWVINSNLSPCSDQPQMLLDSTVTTYSAPGIRLTSSTEPSKVWPSLLACAGVSSTVQSALPPCTGLYWILKEETNKPKKRLNGLKTQQGYPPKKCIIAILNWDFKWKEPKIIYNATTRN